MSGSDTRVKPPIDIKKISKVQEKYVSEYTKFHKEKGSGFQVCQMLPK